MKTIGVLGGMSWESTRSYYEILNQEVKRQKGGLHSAKLCVISVNFAELEACLIQQRWDDIATILSVASKQAEAGGADCLLLATNTMHKVFEQIQQAVTIPIFHIVDATAAQINKDKVTQVGFLGTAFTMEQSYLKDRFFEKFAVQLLMPNAKGIEEVHRVIFEELCLGSVKQESREVYCQVIEQLVVEGAQGIVLGCTEIAMLIQQQHVAVPIYDTATLHAVAAVEWALKC